MTRQRSLIQHQRGSGTSIAVALIMSMILVVSLVQNVFIRGQTLTAEETDRVQEKLSIQHISVNNSSELVICVKNIGPIDMRLVAVWIELLVTQNESQRVTINEWLNIQASKDIILDGSTLNTSSLTDVHTFTVVTERGNSASYNYPQDTPYILPEVYYLGVFGVDWFYSKYASQQNPPDGSEVLDASYIIKSDDYVTFYMKVTNCFDRPCRIISDSFIAFTSIALPEGSGEPSVFLVQNVTYGGTPTLSAYNDSSPLILLANQSQVLMFAGEEHGSENWRWGKGYPFGPETTTQSSDVQICLFYEIFENEELLPTGKYYGQTISTHAVTLGAK